MRGWTPRQARGFKASRREYLDDDLPFMMGTNKVDLGYLEVVATVEKEEKIQGPTNRVYTLMPKVEGEEEIRVLVHPLDLNYLQLLGLVGRPT